MSNHVGNEGNAMRDVQQTEFMLKEGIPIERIHGALLGAAVGDALGWPQEPNAGRQGRAFEPSDTLTFQPWLRKGGSRFEAYEQQIKAGEYSDDTQLMLATARSVLRGKQWVTSLSKQELPLWLLYERGGGGATKRAARAWLAGHAPWKQPDKQLRAYFDAGGNGVAMRVLPHVLKHGQTQAQLMRDVMRNGILTHGHPRALLGAIVYAYAAWWIIHTAAPLPLGGGIQAVLNNRAAWEPLPGNSEGSTVGWFDAANRAFPQGYDAEWKKTVEEICAGLTLIQRAIDEQGALLKDQIVLEQLGCFGKMNGSGVVAALAVLYLFSVYASDPMTGLRTIAFAKSADTDTLASMLGGLFGLTHGLAWMPTPLQNVQDYELFGVIADQLARPVSHREEENVSRWREQDAQQVVDMLQTKQHTVIALGALGNARVQSHRTLKPLTRNLSTAEEWCLQVDGGQTIYITKAQRALISAASKKQPVAALPEEHPVSAPLRTHHGLSVETVETTLQILREVLFSSPENLEVMQTIITDQWNALADTDCELIISRIEQFIQTIHETSADTANLPLRGE